MRNVIHQANVVLRGRQYLNLVSFLYKCIICLYHSNRAQSNPFKRICERILGICWNKSIRANSNRPLRSSNTHLTSLNANRRSRPTHASSLRARGRRKAVIS